MSWTSSHHVSSAGGLNMEMSISWSRLVVYGWWWMLWFYLFHSHLLNQPQHHQLHIQQVQCALMCYYDTPSHLNFIGKCDVTLSLRFLKLFKWRDESGAKQQLRIIETTSSHWEDLATLVGLSLIQMDGIKNECLRETEQCCLRVFDHWIISNGEFTDYPTTWSGLHELLKDIGHKALAKKMKTALQTVGIDTSRKRKRDSPTTYYPNTKRSILYWLPHSILIKNSKKIPMNILSYLLSLIMPLPPLLFVVSWQILKM